MGDGIVGRERRRIETAMRRKMMVLEEAKATAQTGTLAKANLTHCLREAQFHADNSNGDTKKNAPCVRPACTDSDTKKM
ncbi:MAG: hypothetical protein LBO81_05370 [Clostridiales Family XIII bacterium]|nr:hypothetical protein [Clostridiales Family XIII bacterium]